MNTDKTILTRYSDSIAASGENTVGDDLKPGAKSSIIDGRLWRATTENGSDANLAIEITGHSPAGLRAGDDSTLHYAHQLAELVYSASILFTPDLMAEMFPSESISDTDVAQLVKIGRRDCMGETKTIPDAAEIHRLMTFVSVPALAHAIRNEFYRHGMALDNAWYNFDHPLDLDSGAISEPSSP